MPRPAAIGLFAFSFLGAAVLASPVATAETFNTCTGTISSLPAIIGTQGIWCLDGDLQTSATSGDAILITTNNVTIDCNGYKLGGLAGGVGTLTQGISAVNRRNATVRNCNIRGFFRGIAFTGTPTGGHVVEDNRFDGNLFTGVLVEGDGSVVRGNRIFDTGGSTVLPAALGLSTRYSVDIIDNTVSGVAATAATNGSAFGMITSENPDGQIAGNRVRGVARSGSGIAFGIYNVGAGRITLRRNDLVGDGSSGSIGMQCNAGSEPITTDIAISLFVTGIDDCNDDGGNVVNP